jgi:hypothetical protein
MLKIFALVLLVFSQSILADDLYRCGNTYQDTPCKNAVSSKPIGGSSVNKKSAHIDYKVTKNNNTVPAVVNVDCKQRRESAKKIMRMREAGKTVDDQLNAEPDSASQVLIKDVYSHNGSSFQVQNAIEHECIQQQEKSRLSEKQMMESKRLKGAESASVKESAINKKRLSPTPAALAATVLQPPATKQAKPVQPAPTAMSIPANLQNSTTQKVDQEDTQGICSSLKSGLQNISNQKRKGGDATFMKDLNQQQLNLESAMKSAGC